MDLNKIVETWDESDEYLNDKIDRTNLSAIVASASASAANKNSVSVMGTGKNIEVLKLGGKTVQNGTPTPTTPVEVQGVGDYDAETGKYKIPVSVNGTTQNVYLDAPVFDGEIADLVSGKVEKKYEIVAYKGDDSEGWTSTVASTGVLDMRIQRPTKYGISSLYSNHFIIFVAGKTSLDGTIEIGSFVNCYVKTSQFPDVAAWKNWLNAQYDAGKPLVIVYELATPTTETFDGADIPTVSGNNEISIDTAVTPASIDVTTFGDYYSKAEIDRKFAELSDRLSTIETSTHEDDGVVVPEE